MCCYCLKISALQRNQITNWLQKIWLLLLAQVIFVHVHLSYYVSYGDFLKKINTLINRAAFTGQTQRFIFSLLLCSSSIRAGLQSLSLLPISLLSCLWKQCFLWQWMVNEVFIMEFNTKDFMNDFGFMLICSSCFSFS